MVVGRRVRRFRVTNRATHGPKQCELSFALPPPHESGGGRGECVLSFLEVKKHRKLTNNQYANNLQSKIK